MNVLLVIAWALVVLDAILIAVMTITANWAGGQGSASRGMASGLAFAGGLILAAMSGLLLFSSRHGSVTAAAVTVAVLLVPLLVAGAPLVEHALDRLKHKRQSAKRGKFVNPELAAIAAAIAASDMATLALLLRNRPDLDGRDEAGETLLTYAVENVLEKQAAIDPVRALLDAGANPNQNPPAGGKRIILRVFEASTPVSNELFKLLLDRRADPDTRDRFGVPMLHHAKGQLLKLKLLADSDADINATGGSHFQRGWTPVMALAMDEAYDEALYLVQRGADVHHTAPDGATLSSVVERRRSIAAQSGSNLPVSHKALANAVTVHVRRR